MTDTDFEQRSNQHIANQRIKAIAARAKWLASLPHGKRLAEQHRAAKLIRKRNCVFCKKYPEQCK